MKELKNKSSVYIFPTIFYRLLEEGMEENIINHIHDTYLSSKNDSFVLVLDRRNVVNHTNIEEQSIANLLNCKSILNKDYEEIDDRLFSIEINRGDELDELVKLFVEGKYSQFDDSDIRSILDFSFNYCTINFYIKVGYVLFKSKEYRKFLADEYNMDLKDFPEDQELDDIVNINDELYDNNAKEALKSSYPKV